MANSTDTQWSPPHGRHQVNIGASLSRTLKARKGLQAKPSRNMPVSDFYLVKCEWVLMDDVVWLCVDEDWWA